MDWQSPEPALAQVEGKALFSATPVGNSHPQRCSGLEFRLQAPVNAPGPKALTPLGLAFETSLPHRGRTPSSHSRQGMRPPELGSSQWDSEGRGYAAGWRLPLLSLSLPLWPGI